MNKREKSVSKNGQKKRWKIGQFLKSKNRIKKSHQKSSEKLSEKNDDFFKM